MVTSDNHLELLLADADERRPVLEEGLPGEAAQRGPKPKRSGDNDEKPDWRRTDGDINDLPAQRWGVIAPEGRAGDRALEAIRPLLRLREEEQGAPARIYRVPADMDAKQALLWKDEVYWAEDVPEEERPLYLLLLGDLHEVSLELQHALSNAALVGRIHCADAEGEADLAGYAAYAEKVVRFARAGTPDRSPDMLFFVARDGSSATLAGEQRLVAPSLAVSQRKREAGGLPAASVRDLSAKAVGELLAESAGARPSVLLSVGHGLGAPRRGWRSEEERWRRQGALVLGDDEVLDAERLQGHPFLSGGMWFYLSCFGAGTPQTSAYHAWLKQLAADGAFRGKVERVLESLPARGERPFIAALPQAALANPAGPLAVIGHVDLAWTYSFSSATKHSESRKLRILSALEVMVRGGRAGVALEALVRFYREANDALLMSYQLEADARSPDGPDPAERAERGHLWMLRNDLRGYVLLGDPAARLPLQQHTVRAEAPPAAPELQPAARADAPAPATPELQPTARAPKPAPAALPELRLPPTEPADVPLSVKEAAVHALIRGVEAPLAIAERAGAPLDALWAWFDAYRAGGRARLQG